MIPPLPKGYVLCIVVVLSFVAGFLSGCGGTFQTTSKIDTINGVQETSVGLVLPKNQSIGETQRGL